MLFQFLRWNIRAEDKQVPVSSPASICIIPTPVVLSMANNASVNRSRSSSEV